MPLSIQQIIEFANNIWRDGTVIDLNFVEIEEDLKHQYSKCDGNRNLLKQIYAIHYISDNCFYHCGDDRYAMFFGFSDALDGLNWLIDYIFAQMSFCPDGYNNLKHQPELSKNDKTKVITQLLNYLK